MKLWDSQEYRLFAYMYILNIAWYNLKSRTVFYYINQNGFNHVIMRDKQWK